MGYYFTTQDLDVGYNGNVLIHDINLQIEKGKILTLIGPNGAGKSTILKSITRHLMKLHGTVHIDGHEIYEWSAKEMARQVAVMLTDRIRPELMTCEEVVGMGRYPYTNLVGKMTPRDKQIVTEALARVHALELRNRDFMTLSDGQKQRILLARAICQEPEIIVLDEPTAYLDIRHKIELLDILREMAKDKNITVVMSLHEIDLATKISDYLVCVKGDTIAAFGPPDEILHGQIIQELYEMKSGSYDLLYGSVELGRPKGEARVFVVGGGGKGIACYRALQKKQIPFSAGILFENDLDYPVARVLGQKVIVAPAFEPMTQEQFDTALEEMKRCGQVLDAGGPVGSLNRMNGLLLEQARSLGLKILAPTEISALT